MPKSKLKKAKPRLHEFDLTVVGLKYRVDKRQIEQLQEAIEEEGAIPVKLEREPENEVDPKAVKVITLDPERKVFHNWHIGYIRRPANAPLFDLLRRGAIVKMCLLVFLEDDGESGELQVAIVPPPQ